MYDINLSSHSESQQDENFDVHYKKVTYQGHLSDSDNDDSQQDYSISQNSRKAKNQCKITSNKSSDALGKSKIIKKNSESAKMSRQRKKLYLDLLEQKAEELKTNIITRKNTIRNISFKIFQKFQRSNQEKYNFLIQKIALSKRLIAIADEIQHIKKNQEECLLISQVKLEESNEGPIINASQNQDHDMYKLKTKKKKCIILLYEDETQKEQNFKKDFQQKLALKSESLFLGINAFMYEFGVRGSLRTDVVERTKNEWFDNVQRSLVHLHPKDTSQIMGRMRSLMMRLQEKAKKLDYFLRQLKQRVKQRFVVQFLLDREFFIHRSADTIYKNSHIASSQN